ncbi:MAG: LytTR family DNA-binding domain-containing protein [Flavobacteriaceae bacterium]|nr:LytTR family DNA-binding domain-containing protein [Flavobacteriaceae bacterium]
MKIVLIEDETPAIEKLERYLLKYDAAIEIVARLTSIKASVQWFSAEEHSFDLIFMDIQLTDGLSFEIFSKVTISKPVIFITAFDEYAIDAFKVNSVDYILKPVTFTDISKALTKLKKLQSVFSMNETLSKVTKVLAEKKRKDRFLVKLGNHIHSIKTEDIALFYAEGRTVFLVNKDTKKFIVEYNLEALEDLVAANQFFRVNRTFIVNINAIQDVIFYSNSRLKIRTAIPLDKEIIVSREKVKKFKNWFEGN